MPRNKKNNVGDDRPLSLDEAASLLVVARPNELDELARVHRSLSHLATDPATAATVRPFLEEAAARLQTVLQGQSPDPEQTILEVGRLIEWAMAGGAELEDAEETGTGPAPQPEQASGPAPGLGLPDDADLSFLTGFVEESREYLEAAEAAMLLLESNPDDMEACNTVFRAFHTIKGTSAFLGLDEISELAHHAESLLSRVRDREIRFTGGYADLALRAVDLLKEYVDAVNGALHGKPLARPAGYDALLAMLENPEAAGISEASSAAPAGVAPVPAAEGPTSPTTPTREARPSATDHTGEAWVRVRTDRLDRLIDMIGELVVAHSIVAQDAAQNLDANTERMKNIAHAGKIVRELQDLSVSLRMVPLKATFQKMARLARDVAHKCGKLVNYVTEAEETEIDRNMVELINDPLIHMIRNAIDHGIEPPDVRARLGKPRAGTVRLSAYHASGNVVIEVSDDGRGLDRDKILKKAIALGLVESDRGLSDNDIFNLIFEPGFSTAEQVTDVSGRGVGMDVVRRNIEAVRGRIEITSEPGKGSTFSIRLPLTLAVTDGMLVRVGQERYIVPTTSIQMSFRPTPEALSTVTGRGEMVLLRGELIPIVRLHQLFDIPGAVETPTEALLVVIGAGERRCALLVDELLAQQQVVAKSLGAGIGHVPGISGGAILGDGRVGLILDPAEIIALSRQSRSGDGAPAPLARSAA
ncbi:MAG TPA: chemotaxis protein CheA [Longimicrobiales bacterium]